MKKFSFLFFFIPFMMNAADDSSLFQEITLWGPGRIELAHLKVAEGATGKDVKRGYAKLMGEVEFCPGRSLLVDLQQYIEVKDTIRVPKECTDLCLLPRSNDPVQCDFDFLQEIYDKKDLEILYAVGIVTANGLNPSLFKK